MSGGANRSFKVNLLTFLFLAAAAVYVVLTFVSRPHGFPLSPWEFAYRRASARPILWASYVLTHPCFAILWAGFIAAAAVQFRLLRERGRAALELASWMVLLFIAVAALIAAQSPRLDWFASLAIFTFISLPGAAPIIVIRMLRSPKVRAAMVDRPRSGEQVPCGRIDQRGRRDYSPADWLLKLVSIIMLVLLAVAAAYAALWALFAAGGEFRLPIE
ncbi:MAG: hypothetical protein JSV79_02920 [Armatimonadota bacterium]|nr:MAG: hypothetical protein JSV79_02920 [Armatimonadota bacterium]